MGVPLLDEHGLPPTGARVYVKSRHAIGTVRYRDGKTVEVHIEATDSFPRGVGGDDLIVIGPPELLGHCAVDMCPMCDEMIRVRKHEQ